MVDYTYDSNGNLLNEIIGPFRKIFRWDAENQLVQVGRNAPGGQFVELASFAYDPLGRRVEKVAGGVTTSYTYNSEDILKETNGGTTYIYVHGPGIDEPLARENSGVLSYYHVDGLGSIIKMTDNTGAVVHEYRYDAWGDIEVGENYGGYAFTGREWDPELGMHYYRARYYDPRIVRFISSDPIGFMGGINVYTYVSNQPTLFIDPWGLAGSSSGMGMCDYIAEHLYQHCLAMGKKQSCCDELRDSVINDCKTSIDTWVEVNQCLLKLASGSPRKKAKAVRNCLAKKAARRIWNKYFPPSTPTPSPSPTPKKPQGITDYCWDNAGKPECEKQWDDWCKTGACGRP
jgi:RHS repeat-associated protein